MSTLNCLVLIGLAFSILIQSRHADGSTRSDNQPCQNENPQSIDHKRCEKICKVIYGRNPELNVPWAVGRCKKINCICKINAKYFNKYLDWFDTAWWKNQNVNALIAKAQDRYKEKLKSRKRAVQAGIRPELGQVFDYTTGYADI